MNNSRKAMKGFLADVEVAKNPGFRFNHPCQRFEMMEFLKTERKKKKRESECLAALYRQCDYSVLGWVREHWVELWTGSIRC